MDRATSLASRGVKRAMLPGVLLALALLILLVTDRASARGRRQPIEFEELRFFVEANATDSDAEVNFEWDSDAALRSLEIFAPGGRRVLQLTSRDRKKLGLRKGIIETPEPALEDVLAAYPEGVYRFKGRGVGKEVVLGEVQLSHTLPPSPVITSPAAGATGVGLEGLTGTWNAVPGATAYALELETETEDGELKLKVDVDANATSFVFPPGWVLPGAEYQFGVAVKGVNGNVSVSEVQFTTES